MLKNFKDKFLEEMELVVDDVQSPGVQKIRKEVQKLNPEWFARPRPLGSILSDLPNGKGHLFKTEDALSEMTDLNGVTENLMESSFSMKHEPSTIEYEIEYEAVVEAWTEEQKLELKVENLGDTCSKSSTAMRHIMQENGPHSNTGSTTSGHRGTFHDSTGYRDSQMCENDPQNDLPIVEFQPTKLKIEESAELEMTEEQFENFYSKYYTETSDTSEMEDRGQQPYTGQTTPESRNRTQFYCFVCRIDLVKMSKYEMHMASKHRNLELFACSICGNKYANKNTLSRHIKLHKPKEVFTCDICGIDFNHLVWLLRHKKRDHKVRLRFYCDSCNMNFCYRQELTQHLNFHNRIKKPFQCELCDVAFKLEDSLSQHLITEIHSSNLRDKNRLLKEKSKNIAKLPSKRRDHISCEICNRIFKNLRLLNNHLERHARETLYQCKDCERVLSSRVKLELHQKRFHSGYSFKCDFCDKTFRFEGVLQNHVLTHEKLDRFVCKRCNKSFDNALRLDGHLRLHNIGNKFVTCEICGEGFACRRQLIYHMKHKIHSGDKQPVHKIRQSLLEIQRSSNTCGILDKNRRNYSCDTCGKVFTSKVNLHRHVELHLDDTRMQFFCMECDRGFQHKKSFEKHSKKHAEVKNFTCKICDKDFLNEPLLTTHNKIHTGEYVVSCKFCDKKFAHEGHLLLHSLRCGVDGKNSRPESAIELHEMIPKDIQSYPCEECGKNFQLESNLREHLTTRHTECYFCELCSRKFIFKSNLEAHMKAHTNGKLLLCQVCGKGFSYKTGLSAHIVVHDAEPR